MRHHLIQHTAFSIQHSAFCLVWVPFCSQACGNMIGTNLFPPLYMLEQLELFHLASDAIGSGRQNKRGSIGPLSGPIERE